MAGGVLNRLRNDREWTWPIGKIVVTYTAGYALVTDLPYGVERAAIAACEPIPLSRRARSFAPQ